MTTTDIYSFMAVCTVPTNSSPKSFSHTLHAPVMNDFNSTFPKTCTFKRHILTISTLEAANHSRIHLQIQKPRMTAVPEHFTSFKGVFLSIYNCILP